MKVKMLQSVHVYAHFVVLGLIIGNVTSAHQVWSPRHQWYRRQSERERLNEVLFTVTLTLKTIQFLHKSLQLMMMYHPIKFHCRKSANQYIMVKTVIFDYMSPNCDFGIWRQRTNLLAWHSGPWWCTIIPSLVTKGSAVEEMSSRWSMRAQLLVVGMLRFMSLTYTNRAYPLFLFCSCSVFAFMALSTVFHSINSADNSPPSLSLCSSGLISALLVLSIFYYYFFMKVFLSSHILIISSFTVTLTLTIANQSFGRHPGSWWCIPLPSLINDSAVQKMSSG